MRVVVAGTFGPLHDGHRALLTEALRRGDEGVVVGLTSDEFANRTRDRDVSPYADRKRTLEAAIDELDEWDREVEIRAISDRYGVADEDPSIDAIVVSEETEAQVAEINRRREERGLDSLSRFVVPMVEADDGDRISSTRIAHDEIDERGRILD